MLEVYAWEGDHSQLLLIDWRTTFENGWGETPVNMKPQPYVVNGDYFLERSGGHRLSLEGSDRTAYYVCKAPRGSGYNDILGKVQEPLFSPQELN